MAIAGNAGFAHLSQNSKSRRLTKSGMHSRVAAIKDILTEEHRAARLEGTLLPYVTAEFPAFDPVVFVQDK